LKLQGVEMIRITAPRFDADPGGVIDRLKRHLAQRHYELTLAQPRSAVAISTG
jgi:hypothetical protein